MCGIAGILGLADAEAGRAAVERMTAALSHRGPDGDGFLVRGPVAIGHRRLSIIDLASGRQPMCNEDEQVWITFNGEIYNFRDLRRELEAAGHRFRSQSDTEVIIHAYEQWGDDCVTRLRGMFAFCVADFGRRQLFLARDHFGIKPLVYMAASGQFAFASEIAALARSANAPLTLDLGALDEYLWLQYIPAPKTVYREIRKLPPACRMTVAFDGQTSGPEEYWRLSLAAGPRMREKAWIEAVDATIRDSVRAHLVSDVPFGAFLSGGVDSSLVLAYMSEILKEPVTAFTIGFEEAEFSEVAFARAAASACGAQHRVETVRPEGLAILPELVAHYGEPFGDSSAVPTYYVSRMARREVPMVLSGDGGDELFAGYETYGRWLSWLSYDDPWRAPWRRPLRAWAGRLAPCLYPPRRPSLDQWLSIIHYADRACRTRLWRPEFSHALSDPPAAFRDAFREAGGAPPCRAAQWVDLRTYLPNDILAKVDVASMMHGLEVRPPLIDVRVAELAVQIPEPLSIRRTGPGTWDGKRLLKQVASRYYPMEFLNRRKTGFSIPAPKWFGGQGSSRVEVERRLLSPESPLGELFRPAAVRELVAAEALGPVWLLLFLDEWLRQNRAGLRVA